MRVNTPIQFQTRRTLTRRDTVGEIACDKLFAMAVASKELLQPLALYKIFISSRGRPNCVDGQLKAQTSLNKNVARRTSSRRVHWLRLEQHQDLLREAQNREQRPVALLPQDRDQHGDLREKLDEHRPDANQAIHRRPGDAAPARRQGRVNLFRDDRILPGGNIEPRHGMERVHRVISPDASIQDRGQSLAEVAQYAGYERGKDVPACDADECLFINNSILYGGLNLMTPR